MPRSATALAARLRAATRAQHAFSFNIDAAKARTAQFEPTLQLAGFRSVKEDDDDDDKGGDDLPWMTTYSAFDPGASRPLLYSSICFQDNIPGPSPWLKLPEREERPTTAATRPCKPWPYSLPAFLRPKPGTTFALMHGTDTTIAMDETVSERIGFLQAVLYGVPAPDDFSYTGKVVIPGGFLHKVLYGAPDPEEDGKHGAVAKGTVRPRTHKHLRSESTPSEIGQR